MARVLIVDDERSIRRTLGEFLRDAGYDVAEAEDADSAMAHLRGGEVDVVVSDIVLPRITGVELLRLTHETSPGTQVVMMTGEPTVETAAEALRLGAADYLFKPIDKVAILRAAGNAARIKALEDERRRLEAENRAHRDNLKRLVEERTAQLQASESRYRSLVETTHDWVWEVDPQGRYTYASPRIFELLGYRPEEVMGRTPFDLMPEAEARRLKPIFEQLAAERAPFVMLENTNRHREGHLVILETSGMPILSPTGEFLGYHGMDRDVTVRRKAEDQLRQLARAVAQSPASIVITDRHGTIEFVNPKFTEVTGYTAEEVVGLSPRVLKSGETSSDKYRDLWETIVSGKEWRGEFCNRRKDGSLFWEHAVISGVRDESGEITHFIAVKEDISERRSLEQQLRHAQKMEAVGQLAGGVAHDFNNILEVILLNAEMGASTDGLPEETRESLSEIRQATHRAANLTKQLLLFSRRQIMQPRNLDLNEIVSQLARMLRRILGEDIRLELRLDSERLITLADEGMLEQVLLNLSVNARDAMTAGGTLTIETFRLTLGSDAARRHPDAVPGVFVGLRVCDTGCGIAPEILPRIFEPFFTTKEQGKGTGLGLATVFGIVKQHRGWIEVESEPGRGTCFEVAFSAVNSAADARTKAHWPGEVLGGTETLLLVEDDTGVRTALGTLLRRLGYKVLEAGHGVEALRLEAQHSGVIDLLLTDLVLPEGMDGRELVRRLQVLRPECKVILMTGYDPALAGRAVSLQPGQGFLQKPCAPEQLLREVRRCLGRGQG
ncbi:MAG: PAS domain S-box protein [Verrucomicrobiales bacterium]|nr:PAS domain S-box protein [Verrucomicrobiales bacterium]